MPKIRTKVRGLLIRWFGLVLNLHGVLSVHRFLPFLCQWRRFAGHSRIPAPASDLYPCLADATPRTRFDPHYFFQAAWLARCLAANRPSLHTDIGSDVGMVGVISAFVPVTFLDFRPLDVSLEGLVSGRGDLSALTLSTDSISSLSCLHVLEHIGLARYGDALNAEGHVTAARELARVLAPGGDLYVSVPVGRERVCFNAHRVFSVATVKNLFSTLHLHEFALVNDEGGFEASADDANADSCDYGCGLFHFVKRPRS